MGGGYCYRNYFKNLTFYTLQKYKSFLASLPVGRGLCSQASLWLPTASTELVEFKDYFCHFVCLYSTLY